MNGIINIARRQASSFGGAAPANPDFVSTWDTTQAGSASDTVVLPLLSGGTYSGTIDWGDGNSDSLSYANRTHVYASSGTYTITISGTIEGWQFNNGGDKAKITDVSNWGNLTITTDRAFFGCSNLDISATDAPIISTTSLYETFYGCTSMNGNLGNFDLSGVTDTRSMFLGCTSYNNAGSDSINQWDVSNVVLMGGNNRGMFKQASSFNQPLENWDVSSVTNMKTMFSSAYSFNQNIGAWNTTNLQNISSTLYFTSNFNQALDGWTVSNITSANQFMSFAGLSTVNYDATLVAWEAQLQSVYPSGSGYTPTISISFGSSQYTLGGAGETARTSLISTFGWTITDGGGV